MSMCKNLVYVGVLSLTTILHDILSCDDRSDINKTRSQIRLNENTCTVERTPVNPMGLELKQFAVKLDLLFTSSFKK